VWIKVPVEEGIEFGEKRRVLQIVVLDERKDAVERENRQHASPLVASRQHVRQQQRLRQTYIYIYIYIYQNI
jgi:hypothetical protein